MRVVIDTNIIVASLLSKTGKCSDFMDKVFGNQYEVIVSETIMQEYERVLGYPKLNIEAALRQAGLACPCV